MGVEEKLAAAKARSATIVKRLRPQARRLNEAEAQSIKALVFGPLGSGKTSFLLGPLLSGERVFGLSTDFGGNGLISVVNALKKLGRPELAANLVNVDLSNYEDVIAFLERPEEFVVDLEEFNPTVQFWEGFSTFNMDLLDEYTEVKGLGVNDGDKFKHWYEIKRGTLRAIRKFLGYELNGKRLHKIMTAVESKPGVNELTSTSERGPMIQGSGRDLTPGGFDLSIACFKQMVEGREAFFYRMAGSSDKYAVKSRGFEFKSTEPADPEKIWKVLTSTI